MYQMQESPDIFPEEEDWDEEWYEEDQDEDNQTRILFPPQDVDSMKNERERERERQHERTRS